MDKQLTSTTPGMATIGTSPAAVTARPRVASLGHVHVPLAPEKSALAPPVGGCLPHTSVLVCVFRVSTTPSLRADGSERPVSSRAPPRGTKYTGLGGGFGLWLGLGGVWGVRVREDNQLCYSARVWVGTGFRFGAVSRTGVA